MAFHSLLHAYIETLKHNKNTYRSAQQLMANHFHDWTEPTFGQIEDWAKANQATPHLANKGLGLLKAAYNWGTRRGLYHGVNPAHGVRRCRTYSRDRVLTADEIGLLLHSLRYMSPKLAALLVVLITTGCRLTEALTMRHDLVDLATGKWTTLKTKNGKSQTTYLPTQAREWLKKLPTDSDFFFQGHYGHPYSRCGAEKLWRDLRTQLSIDARLHDFRRTLATFLYLQCRDEMLIRRCLNHYNGSITAIYVRITEEEVAAALQGQADRFFAFPRPDRSVGKSTPPRPKTYTGPKLVR